MLTLSGITKAHGGRTLFSDVTLQLNRGDRLGLVGPNGAGKTTLFSIILGEGSPDDGKIMTERNVVIGYLPQESTPVGAETVIEIATGIGSPIDHDFSEGNYLPAHTEILNASRAR